MELLPLQLPVAEAWIVNACLDGFGACEPWKIEWMDTAGGWPGAQYLHLGDTSRIPLRHFSDMTPVAEVAIRTVFEHPSVLVDLGAELMAVVAADGVGARSLGRLGPEGRQPSAPLGLV